MLARERREDCDDPTIHRSFCRRHMTDQRLRHKPATCRQVTQQIHRGPSRRGCGERIGRQRDSAVAKRCAGHQHRVGGGEHLPVAVEIEAALHDADRAIHRRSRSKRRTAALAERVVAPAADCPRRVDRAGVVETGRHRRHAAALARHRQR